MQIPDVVRWPRGFLAICAMPTHKFQPYQIVLVEAPLRLNMPGGAYMITRKMPERDGEFEYRVKSVNEPCERVVRESQMRKMSIED